MQAETGITAAALSWPEQGIARIQMTRPESHNSLTTALVGRLHSLIDEAALQRPRALILTGSGKSFCGGAHIGYFSDPASPLYRNPRAIRDDYVARIIETFAKLRQAPFVTIAAINGFALGGGCELALSCDLRLAAKSARIGLPEARLGAVAGAGGVQLLPDIVGRSKALEMLLFGEHLTATEALGIGLLSAVHEDEDLDDAALQFASKLLKCSPISIAETKRAVYRCEKSESAEANQIALDAVAIAASGSEWWEGMAAFDERRPPAFATEIK